MISEKITSYNQRINSESIAITPPSQTMQQVDYPKSDDDDPFWGSCVELCGEDQNNGARGVRLANAIASHLKPHQVEGIKFMWRNTCGDLPMIQTREEMLVEKDVGGCILAHMMGLGKFTLRKVIYHRRQYISGIIFIKNKISDNSVLKQRTILKQLHTKYNWFI